MAPVTTAVTFRFSNALYLGTQVTGSMYNFDDSKSKQHQVGHTFTLLVIIGRRTFPPILPALINMQALLQK